ncbi:ABC transporter permease [Aestuariicoccus sp. MJ-SS9]|uniref:ABC transporter permease n=1 Tax=Aestuariicoccus sp. MJ-SS9 TaxID=3079855 RepID=UPI00290CB65C|nr:FtsX-like permease family protein [Aestuariicoccus sp. MJ-SS9]MDU8913678.1 FtsX-like permease family protein [Aestuariicoccus sp. MJ-SS9]
MRALEKKLLRDFLRLWSQGLAIALVLGCGVSIFIMSFGMFQALNDTRAAYYERNRFAEVFAAVRRAPKSLVPEIAAIDGVYAVETRVTGTAILDLPGRVESGVGQLISLPSAGAPRVNVPLLRSGRLPDPQSSDEVLVNEPFAIANGYVPGDVFHANLNGQKRPLTITGTALSPEFIYTIGPGDIMPDNRRFGILWMPEPALAAAFDMAGAFNDLGLLLEREANADDVIDAVDDLLDPYGAQGAYDRAQQQSNAFIDGELTQLKSMAYVLPPIFFGITIFLVNMVIGRIVSLERSEIGLMKAIGYSDVEVCLHYLYLAGLIALVGLAAGFGVGTWFSHGLARIYADFFNFPYLIFSVSADVYIIAGALGLITAALGAVQSALGAARLPPAVAMSPPAPPNYRKTLADRALALLRLSQPTVMLVRNILRWPFRAALTMLGLALAVAVLVASAFFQDSLDEIVDTAFYKSNRQDAMLMFTQEANTAALEEIRRLPGVLQVEGMQVYPAILRNGHLHKHVAIEGRPADADLSRIVAADGRIVPAPEAGVLLSKRLAAQLGVGPGDPVTAEFLSGRRETHELRVAGIVTSYIGLGAYMEIGALDRLMRRAPTIGMANVTVDPAQHDAFHTRVKDMPGLAGTVMMGDTLASFEETIEENITLSTIIYNAIAILITVGVAYNSARIQLSERARDLSSLRILGFTKGEVSYILIGETALLVVLAQPLGWLLGAGLAAAMVAGFESDLYSIPLVLNRDTFASASCVVLAAAAVSALLVRRRLDSLNLIEVMKTRE